MKCKKHSKRQTCAKRYKIEKKVRQHLKKQRREAKKNPSKFKKPKRDIGVPNSAPFKEQVIKEALELRTKQEEERQKLHQLRSAAKKEQREHEKKELVAKREAEDNNKRSKTDSSRAFFHEFKKVVEMADVILEVLDCRDPLGTRCKQVEDAVISAGTDKRLVLVLNKIDLVPRENLEAWLKYLREELPTVPFKASTQLQKSRLSQIRKVDLLLANEGLNFSSRCLGADLLMKMVGNYSRNSGMQRTIRVGVVGYPNVGKSSIINSLKRAKACNVGATPGLTRSLQEVSLDSHIKLIDSPGMVVDATSESETALRNAKKLETLEDPVGVAECILKRASRDQLMVHYRVPPFNDVRQFLSLLAKKRGLLKRGGLPCLETAARKLLQDWNQGKIKYYTHPPEKRDVHIAAEIVSGYAKEFDLDALAEEEEQTIRSMPLVLRSDAILMDSSSSRDVTNGKGGEEQKMNLGEEDNNKEEGWESCGEEEAMEDGEGDENSVVVTSGSEKSAAKQRKRKKGKNKDYVGNELPNASALQQNRVAKKALKLMKKKQKRDSKKEKALSASLANALSLS